MNILNDFTAASFSVGFFQLVDDKKTPKTVQLWRKKQNYR